MLLPFGLQLRGVIVGLLIAYFLIPFVQAFLAKRMSKGAAPAS
jgi:hypothetical protein